MILFLRKGVVRRSMRFLGCAFDVGDDAESAVNPGVVSFTPACTIPTFDVGSYS
jgi:hypothetical protein